MATIDGARLQDMGVVRMLLTQRVIVYHPAIAEITGDVKAALFLCQLMYWSDKGEDQRGWIYKTRDEWTEETQMGRKEQEGARRKLRTLDLIQEAQHGTNRVMYYRVNWLTLGEHLKRVSHRYKRGQCKGLENVPLHGAEGGPCIKETENTTETTTYIYTDGDYPWLGKLREIDGWAERGEPLVKSLVAWADKKGLSADYLYDHAVGVSAQATKGLKGSNNLASKFQVACNKQYYAVRNGGSPAATSDEIKLEEIKAAKAKHER